jgi:hypothetical protein
MISCSFREENLMRSHAYCMRFRERRSDRWVLHDVCVPL